MKKIQVTINLLNRQTDKLIQSNIELDELIKMCENQKSDFHKKYSIDIEMKFDGYLYIIEDYFNEFMNEPLKNIENISKYGNKLENLEHIFNSCTRRNEIIELYDIEENTFENILEYFDGDEMEAKEAMKNHGYNKYDEYIYYSFATDLISFDELPYEEYCDEIFNLWLHEIIYL